MKYWLLAAAVLALAASLVLNGEAATFAIAVNLAVWGLLGAGLWRLGKYLLARGEGAEVTRNSVLEGCVIGSSRMIGRRAHGRGRVFPAVCSRLPDVVARARLR